MQLQTHCELGTIVALKGIEMAVASYHSVPAMNTKLIDLTVVDEDETHVICKDNKEVFHAVPKKAVYNPLTHL